MKVYVDPPTHLSQAMFRIAKQLRRYAPDSVEIVNSAEEADLQVLHVIGLDAVETQHPLFAVIQYCVDSASINGPDSQGYRSMWSPFWDRAALIWSYYEIENLERFYFAPLGVDGDVFKQTLRFSPRTTGVMTSGYVTGPGAEAIEEMAIAAERVGLSTVHLGPKPQGMTHFPARWSNINGVPDNLLAAHYCKSRWVSGLRHVEGFELPVLEGLACGARPIVFDRPEMRHWYDGHAIFVPECSGEELINLLVNIMSQAPAPVLEYERSEVLRKFNWETIVRGFWSRLLENV